MGDDQVDNYVPQCSNVLWSELNKNPKNNNLPVITVNINRITRKITDSIANLNHIRKRFNFIIIKESWLTENLNLS